MDMWQTALGFGAASVVLYRNDLRVSIWTCLAAICFIIPDHIKIIDSVLANGFVDAFNCILLYLFGRYQWEMRLYGIWLFSILLSLMRSVGITQTHFEYAISLEICNWAAIIVMAWPWGRYGTINLICPIRNFTMSLFYQVIEDKSNISEGRRISRISIRYRMAGKI